FDTTRLRFDTRELSVVSSGVIRLHPATARDNDNSLMRFELDSVDLVHRDSGQVLFQADGLEFLVDGRDIMVGTPLRDVAARAIIRESGVPDLRAMNLFIPENLRLSVASGSGELSGSLNWEHGEMVGTVRITSHDLEILVRETPVKGLLTLELNLSAQPDSRFVAIDGTRIYIDDVTLTGAEPEFEPWVGGILIEQGRVTLPESSLLPAGRQSIRNLVDFSDGSLMMSGTINNLDLPGYLLTEERRVTFDGPGRFDAKLELLGGALGQGSFVRFDSSQLTARFLDFDTRGAGSLLAEVKGRSSDRTLDVSANIEDVIVARRGSTDKLVESPKVTVRMSGRSADVTEPLGDVQIDFRIARADVPDITVYNAYLPESGVLRLVSGSGAITSRFEVDDEAGSGWIELAAPAVSAIVNDNPVTVDLALEVEMSSQNIETRQFSVGGSYLRVSNVRYPDGTTLEDWSTTFKFEDGSMRWTTPLELDVGMTLEMSSSAPLIQLLTGRYSRLKWVDDLLSVSDVRGSSRVRLDRDSLVLNKLNILGENVRLSANLLIRRDGAEGILYNQLGPFKATVEFKGQDREWFLFSARERFEKHTGY
ncbi:MAG: hypothetical protein DWQ08_01185, partial [Proteobacteria bacterium]